MLNTSYSKSIAFPKIFNRNGGFNTYNGWNSLKSDLKLLLMTERGTLYGDPNYGVAMKKIIYSQAADEIVIDLLRDDIFEAIKSYFPERIIIDRDDIKITKHNIINEGTGGNGICKVNVEINLKGKLSGEQDNLAISLLMDEQ